jgi:hypothetical protein
MCYNVVTRTGKEVTMPEDKALIYRGYPLRRMGDILYYGELNGRYVVTLKVTKSEPLKDLQIAQTVLIKLMNNDPSLESRKRTERRAEKDGLYPAIDLAATWLDRCLKDPE